MKDKRYAKAKASAAAAITVIGRSQESQERKAELIRDFENYIAQLKTLDAH